MATSTPWGAAQSSTRYARGIMAYTTASHGGFHLTADRLAQMPPQYRKVSSAYCPMDWFEEDCEWALVALSFPSLFPAADVEAARLTYEHGWCDAVILREFGHKKPAIA